MAIYHLSTKVFSRGKGQSATAAAAYRAGVDIYDSRTGEWHRYSNRGGVMESEIHAPPGSPDWVHDRSKLWNEAEAKEDRSTRPQTAQIAREIEVSLPHELPHDSRKELLTTFIRDRYVSKGFIADISYHQPEPGKNGDDRNYHAHILISMRAMNEHGEFQNKDRTWLNRKDLLKVERQAWADYLNLALERAGSQERVSPESFEERGLNRLPGQHLGPEATAIERRGEKTRIGDENRAAYTYNKLAELDEEMQVIDLEIEREKRRLADAQKRQAALVHQEEKSRLSEKAKGFQDEIALLAQRQERMRLKHLDERRTLEAQIDRKRYELIDSNEQIYDKRQAQEALETAQKDLRKAQTMFGRLSGQEQALLARMEALRLNLEDIERRQSERRGQFDRFAAEQLAGLASKHQEEVERLHAPPLLDHDSETEDIRPYTPDSPAPRAVNDNEHLPDHDSGPELDR